MRIYYALWVAIWFAIAYFLQPAKGASVTLAWDANPEPDIAGYKVYYGTESGSYLEPLTLEGAPAEPQFTVPDLDNEETYYFVVTAFNENGLESLPSNEVVAEIPAADSYPSPAFEQVALTAEDPPQLRFTLRWETYPGAQRYKVWAGGAVIRTTYDPRAYVDLVVPRNFWPGRYATYYITAELDDGTVLAISGESSILTHDPIAPYEFRLTTSP